MGLPDPVAVGAVSSRTHLHTRPLRLLLLDGIIRPRAHGPSHQQAAPSILILIPLNPATLAPPRHRRPRDRQPTCSSLSGAASTELRDAEGIGAIGAGSKGLASCAVVTVLLVRRASRRVVVQLVARVHVAVETRLGQSVQYRVVTEPRRLLCRRRDAGGAGRCR